MCTFATLSLLAAAPVAAEVRDVAPGLPLADAVAAARDGDVLRLLPGVHSGPAVIDRQLTLTGEEGVELVGNGKGSVLTLTAPGIRIEGLTIRGSGRDLPAMDSGILVRQQAPKAVIRNNRFEGNLFGVYLHGAAGSLVENNVIIGHDDLRLSEVGNGVSIWNAPGAQVTGNKIRYGRDGIFVTTSRDNLFKDNSFKDLRFAIHYMYTQDSRVIGNRSEDNHVGWAIMFSDRLEIRDNVSIRDRDHGLMLNATNESQITGNIVRDGGEKCVFIYNANKNLVADNLFQGCPIGVHFTAGSERNRVTGNAFIGNRTQVKYVGTRTVEWSVDERGNYYSDHPAFDLDGDGISDKPYRPNDLIDEILWTLPQAKLLLNSPAVTTIRWAQSRFPALYPGGVVDSAPLMQPPRARAIPEAAR
ncbi:nitrous oxide reductase family maturation protein NosD [Pelagibius sp. CAU 1746]|uniref:nitrous oxide reductase family maturation protein NosD n=1 Tax=Pelagibius sp. CAU 1746 TaxID=3140370 RepID=UPI00325C3228